MKITFLSNYYNHHQSPFSQAMAAADGVDYTFIQTKQMSDERRALGYGTALPDFVLDCSGDTAPAGEEVLRADVVVAGSAPENLLTPRIQAGKLLFRYAERPLKLGFEPAKYMPRLLRWRKRNPKNKPIYLLCASGYTAGDYRRFGLFGNRAYRWGYFPQTVRYADPETLMEKKDPKAILWCGRFIPWKHPMDALTVARRLRDAGVAFSMTFVGTGELEGQMRAFIDENRLSECVTLAGSMPPEQVRAAMENAGIYLHTSDRQEGWGAVLNESMNAGCAAVSSHLVGAAPFLVKPGENGCVYPSGDVDALYEIVKELLENPEKQRKLGLSAYETIVSEWNAEEAARRLLTLSNAILAGDKYPDLYESGPCSRAEIVKESWYKR